jgi:hypothetical protein
MEIEEEKILTKHYVGKKGVIPCRVILAMKSAQIKKYRGSEVIKINQSTSEPTVSPGKDFGFNFFEMIRPKTDYTLLNLMVDKRKYCTHVIMIILSHMLPS